MTFPARLTELLEKATKGPWAVDPDDRPGMSWNNHIVQVGTDNTICFMAHDPRDNSGQQAAAELIAYLVNHAEAIRDLAVAAKKAQEAMNVWVNTYAPEFCDKEHVENSRKIISESGGTLAYIADINEQIHEALAKLEEA